MVMQALLAGDPATGLPSMRGMIDLIYIDPPFDSKADYRTKITLPGKELEQKPTVLEQAAYADTWKDDTASYLRMIYPRLALMRELLSDQGSIYVHIDWHVGHYVKALMDEIFGKDNLRNEIIWGGVLEGQSTRHSHLEGDFRAMVIVSKAPEKYDSRVFPTNSRRPESLWKCHFFCLIFSGSHLVRLSISTLSQVESVTSKPASSDRAFIPSG
jgi:DNA methylase